MIVVVIIERCAVCRIACSAAAVLRVKPFCAATPLSPLAVMGPGQRKVVFDARLYRLHVALWLAWGKQKDAED